MLLRLFSIAFAALLIGRADVHAEDEPVGFSIVPRDGTKPLDIELKEATNAFTQIFNDTCFKNRKSLSNLHIIASESGWNKMPATYPNRKEGSTTEIAWTIYDGDVPYHLELAVYDNTAPALTCILSAIAIRKSTLIPMMQEKFDLQVRKKLAQDDFDTILLETKSDPTLRVGCSTVHSDQSFEAQCALVRTISTDS